MKRRNFFTIIAGSAGLVFLNSNDSFEKKQTLTNTSIKFVHRHRTEDELCALYGNAAVADLKNLRKLFLEDRKILSTTQFFKHNALLNRSELHVSLIFDSSSSKEEYISARKKIFTVEQNNNTFSTNKA